jgi:hypothetical protein
LQQLAVILKKKLVLAVLAAVVVGSGAYAFAASLNVTSSGLSAGNAAVGSCTTAGAGNDIKLTYTSAWDSTSKKFLVDSIAFSNVPLACQGKTAQIQFTDGTTPTPVEVGTLLTGVTLPSAATGTYAIPTFASKNIVSQSVYNVNLSIA